MSDTDHNRLLKRKENGSRFELLTYLAGLSIDRVQARSCRTAVTRYRWMPGCTSCIWALLDWFIVSAGIMIVLANVVTATQR